MIFVGVPWLRNGDIYEEYLQSCKQHIQNQSATVPLLPIFVSSPSAKGRDIKRSRQRILAITDALNEIIEAFLKTEASHLWIVDADVEVPTEALDKLLSLDVDIASGVYSLHGDQTAMCAGHLSPSPSLRLMQTTEDYMRHRILGEHQPVAAGNGCLLIKRRVFEEGKFSVFDEVQFAGKPLRFRSTKFKVASDLRFFQDAQEQGFSARIHGDVMCGHLPNWPLEDLLQERPSRNISVVVCHYNKVKEFERLWEILRPQLLIGDELILVDNYTKDFEPRGKCLKFVRPTTERPGYWRLNTLRNLGVGEAKNDAILMLDPDIIPSNDIIARARLLFKVNTVFGGRIDFYAQNGVLEADPRLNWKMLKDNPEGFVDNNPAGNKAIWGGCLLFSKTRTSWLGWFTKKYNGAWGEGENDFAEKCYHSGMRLKYERSLRVKHSWHKSYREGYARNRELFHEMSERYWKALDKETNYKPEVLVLICSYMRPEYIVPCVEAVFHNIVPFKVLFVNQGDVTPEYSEQLKYWMGRWCFKYQFNESLRSMSVTRKEAFEYAKNQGFKYVVTLDDDMIVFPGHLDNLFYAIEDNPQFHIISGYCIDWKGKRLLGGKIVRRGKYGFHVPISYKHGVYEADYSSSGLRIAKLEPLITQDLDYIFGFIDFDYSQRVRQAGLKVGVSGDAGGMHKCFYDSNLKSWIPLKPGQEKPEYRAKRLNRESIKKHRELYTKKWGYEPMGAKEMRAMGY